MSKKGFTLLELLITIAILGALTVLASQAISQAIKVKVKLQDQIDDVSRLRSAMRLMERDINLAFHYRDLEKDLYEAMSKKNSGQPGQQQQQQQQQQQNPMGGGFTGFGTPASSFPGQTGASTTNYGKYDAFAKNREVPRKDPVTHIVGQADSINFVTSNNARTVKDSKVADFMEVGYSLKDCRSLSGEGASSKCLWRRSTPYVDDDVTKGGDELVLLENVSEFKLRYIGKGKQDWTESWRSDEGGDAVTKNRYPEAVEISVTVQKTTNGKNKKYSMQVIVPIHFPNNAESSGGSTTNATPQNPWQTAPATSQ